MKKIECWEPLYQGDILYSISQDKKRKGFFVLLEDASDIREEDGKCYPSRVTPMLIFRDGNWSYDPGRIYSVRHYYRITCEEMHEFLREWGYEN